MINYNRVITDEEQKILEHDLVNINEWIDGMIAGKINNCMKRAAKDHREILKNEVDAMIPAQDKTAALTLFERPNYKNRQERDLDGLDRSITKEVI